MTTKKQQPETHTNAQGEVHQGRGIDCPECKKIYELLESGTGFAVTGEKTGGSW